MSRGSSQAVAESISIARLPSGVRLFAWVRLRSWLASLRQLLAAPAKLFVLILVWPALLGGLYLLADRGIRFVYDASGLGPFVMERLWFLFLFVSMALLGVSQLASAYSTLVLAQETRCWMTLPVSARSLCRAKWVESSFYSAWAVAVLVLPLCLAYLNVLKRPPWFLGYVAGVLLLPWIGIVTSLSTTILLLWLRWVGCLVIRREAIPVAFVLAAAGIFWMLGERYSESSHDVWFLALQDLLPRMQVATSKWLPSSWVAIALDAGLDGRWIEGGLYACLLWTSALGCWRLLDYLSAAILFPVLRQHAQPLYVTSPQGRIPARSADNTDRAAGSATAGSTVERAIPAAFSTTWWMRHPMAALLMKDVLLVIRDPMQWSQGVMFFGLLGAYFANIHRLAQLSVEPSWRIGVASLNLACTLLVLGSLAVRFVFPQMSLEGRSLWLIRIAPSGMRRLMWAKLGLYGVIAVVVVDGLLALSASRLGLSLTVSWWLAGVGTIAALTLIGLTVGLGAWWINPDAQDAARIVSSSNGALVLVLMLGYVGCVVSALVAVWGSGADPRGMTLASMGLIGGSLVIGGVPIRQGMVRLERMEGTA